MYRFFLCIPLAACGLIDPTPPAPADPATSVAPTPPAGAGGLAGGGGGAIPGAAPGAGASSHGGTLYVQYCGVCHGADGSGGPPFPESIQGDTGMFQIVNEGKGAMPAFPALTRDDVLAMEVYLASFLDGGAAPPQPIAPAAPATPLQTYNLLCASCHGADGDGTALGPQMLEPVYPFATWVTRNGRTGAGYPEPMPAYTRDVISDEMLEGILDLLANSPRPSDGRGLYRRFCGNCHGPDGRGGPSRQGIRGEDLDEWIETTRDGEGGRNYGARRDYMPAWSARQISDAEIRKMYDYIRSR